MRIHRWSIEGFGLPRRSDSGDLPHGLAFIRAADESSKAALLGVVPSVLFGADNGASSANGYRAGRGWLVLGARDGEHRIEWDGAAAQPPHLVFPDGHVGSRADLRDLLHGADESLFRSVNVLRGEDLAAFGSFTKEDLGEQLLSKVMYGAEAQANAVASDFAHRATELLGEGENGRIPQLVRDLAQCRSRLAAAQAGEPELVARLARARHGRDELARLDELLASCGARSRRGEILLRLWPLWQEMGAVTQRLRNLESIEEFPDQAGELLAAIRENLAKFAAAAQRLRRERQLVERQLAERVDDAGASSVAGEIGQLHDELTSYRNRLMALATARARHEQYAREFDRGMAEIGAGWGAKRAVRFDLESLDEDAVHAWAGRLEVVAQRELGARQRLALGQGELHGLCDSVAAELREDTPLAEDPLDEKWRALWRVRARLDELWIVQSQGEAEARTVEEKEQALRGLEPKKRMGLSSLGQEPLGLLAGIAVILVLWRLSVGDRESAFLCAVGAGALWFLRRAWSWRSKKLDGYERRLRQTASEKLDRARRARDAQWQRAAEIGVEIAPDIATLGLAEIPSVEAVEQCEQALTAEGVQRCASEGGGPRVNGLVLGLLDAEDRERHLSEEWRRDHAELRALRAEWEIWRASAGLPDGVAAERISEWVAAVRSVKAAWSARERAAAEVKRLEPAIAAWEQKARDLLSRGGTPVAIDLCGSALSERLTALAAQAREGKAKTVERARLEERLRDSTARLANGDAEIKRAREERQALLSAAGARDDAELERRLQVFCERRALQATLAALRQSLDQTLSGADDDGQLRSALATESSEDWERERDAVEATRRTLEEQRAALVAQTEEPERWWQALEEVPRLQGECSALEAELSGAVRRWRRLVVAQALVRDSLSEVNRVRVHATLLEASRTVSRMSAGRYRSVLPDESGRRLFLLDASGQRHAVNGRLDRATRENLYLSIRLGMAVSAAQRGTPMPLVMDDVFTKLDPPRARTFVAELERLSRDRQILVFTCDRTTCETATQLGSSSQVVQA